jgi:predicted outer membrane repeat protein
MKRLLTALISATLLATFFAGTPAPTFAAATEDYYIGYGGGSDTGCGEPDFVVDNSNDTNNPNNDRLEDNIQAALDVVDDGDTIIICAGWYTLHGDMALWNGDLDDGAGVNPINITIQGAGVNETVIDGTIDGKNFDSYTVNAFAFLNTNLTVSDLTITQVNAGYGAAIYVNGGDLTIDTVNFDTYALDYNANVKTNQDGGAVWIQNGDLSITDSNFDATTGWNRPDSDLGDQSPVQSKGGAVFSIHGSSTPNTISITGTTFSGNSADTNGGAIWAYCADMSVTDSEFYDNTTGGKGGAIMAKSDGSCTGELSVAGSTFEGNSVLGYFGSPTKWRHMGGAIYSVGQDMTVTNSSFGAENEGNRATNGGAIAMFDSTTGTATLTVSGTDFTDNYSPANGGALWLACVDATITGDSDGTWDSYLEGTSSTFWSNGAEVGGAIYLFGDGYDDNYCGDGSQGSLAVEGVAFDDNFADHDGGAIATQQSNVALADVDIAHSVFYSNYAYSSGGAVNTDNVDLTIDHSLFLSNYAKSDGGALEVTGSGSDLVITDSEFTDNQSWESYGGAIKNSMDTMVVSNTLFDGNGSDEDGGAIYREEDNSYITDLISNSDFIDNSTGRDGDGGAIYTDHSTGISNSTFDDNTTGYDADGGAIRATAFLTVSGSTFDNNHSWDDGGAIDASGDGLTVTNSTFTNNEARWDEGGAIHADLDGEDCPTDTCITIRNSVFRYNYAEDDAGAMRAYDSILIVGSVFENNNTSGDGGAVEIREQDSMIQSSVFRFNGTGWGNGGAIHYCARGTLTVQNSTFHDNSAGTEGFDEKEGGAINSCSDSADLVVSGSTFTENFVHGIGGAIQVEGDFRASGNLFSRNSSTWSGGAIHSQDSVVIESNTIRNNVAGGWGGGAYLEDVDQASTFSRNLVDANTAYNGGGVAIFGSDEGSNRMTIHTNRIWNNVASNNGGGLWANFTEAGALYELATGIKSTMFVRNRAIYGAAGLVEVNSVTKANQRIFTSLTKSNKYQLNRSTMRGWDKLMLKLEAPGP